MKNLILKLSLITLVIVIFSGCGKNVVSVGKIDKNDKSIIIVGSGIVPSKIRQEFRKNGWLVTTQTGFTNTQGINKNNVNLDTKYVYNARYILDGYYREYINGYWFEVTLYDNKLGEDIASFSYKDAPAISFNEMVSIIFDWINNNTQ